ncbi:MBL fold metallo-hydrolase [Halopiger aswanensis]|uniref:Glyoxylase-like metal-dependent hydrolase (Beta-lactamase superfamily II) n=1 Tax=Halopiger aswanensis TaxID=148449 RepID=A0A419WSH6_9EURY|nr:rhodanese-like domain-containing protein [Halopiger aswanensis]RKD98410.1 glyoxylase-like metal-dependent hydrolase (beta-lactamase superfamily II) [Halopiger aswanensis]
MVTTLAADRLAELQDEGDDFVLVDTRPADSYDSWHVPGAVHFPFGPEEELEGDGNEGGDGDANGRLEEFRQTVGDAERVITICAKGISSGNLATQLESATDEYDVHTVDGGMKGWSGVYDTVEVDVGDPGLTLLQLQRRAKGCFGYVVGCTETGEAVAVDPTDDVDEFEVAAEEAGLTIVGVIDTHVHADHISGGRDLAESLAVPYYLGERADEREVEYEYTPLERNEVLAVGDRELKALFAPGHTSEMINLLVDDAALLTADTLHVASTGRTELEFSDDEGEEGARMLYETLHRTILAEPEGLAVLPGHVAVTDDGEFEHGSPGEPIATTIRDARAEIDLLGLAEDEFVERMADAGEKPSNYEEIIDINRGRTAAPPEDRTELELGPNNCSA